jgi:hypothetical protein
MIIVILGASLAPIVIGLVAFQILIWFTPHLRLTYGLAIMAVPMLVVLFFRASLPGVLAKERPVLAQ